MNDVIELNAKVETDLDYIMSIEEDEQSYNSEPSIVVEVSEGESGTRNYEKLIGKPQINGWELQSGENTLTDLGITQLIDDSLGNVESLLATI